MKHEKDNCRNFSFVSNMQLLHLDSVCSLQDRDGEVNMDNKIVIAHLKSLLSAYDAGGVIQDKHSSDFRLIWISETDAKALNAAIRRLEDANN